MTNNLSKIRSLARNQRVEYDMLPKELREILSTEKIIGWNMESLFSPNEVIHRIRIETRGVL